MHPRPRRHEHVRWLDRGKSARASDRKRLMAEVANADDGILIRRKGKKQAKFKYFCLQRNRNFAKVNAGFFQKWPYLFSQRWGPREMDGWRFGCGVFDGRDLISLCLFRRWLGFGFRREEQKDDFTPRRTIKTKL